MMQPWFEQAKLGIFLHWGIYAVDGTAESWPFFTGKIPYDDYMSQLKGFTAQNYNPQRWAEFFREIGADYVVLTTKHHDGVALWDTQLSDLSVVHQTPAGRDLVGPFCEAMRQEQIHVGLYYSHLDWSHPDYPSVWDTVNPDNPFNNFDAPSARYHLPADRTLDEPRWERFLQFHRGQLRELCEQFQPDLLWFDGDWERDHSQWRMAELRDQLHEWSPNVVLNSRIGTYGDYETPEQGVPIVRPEGPWEFCMTMNDSWGYRPTDNNYKSLRQVIRYFVETIASGGRLLLNIGPQADGTFREEDEVRLRGLGNWISRHHEAIKGTEAGLPHGHFHGPSTLSEDHCTLYLFLFDNPKDQISLRGICNHVTSAHIIGHEDELTIQKLGGCRLLNGESVPGVLWVDVPPHMVDPEVTVVTLKFDEPIQLYQGAGRVITYN